MENGRFAAFALNIAIGPVALLLIGESGGKAQGMGPLIITIHRRIRAARANCPDPDQQILIYKMGIQPGHGALETFEVTGISQAESADHMKHEGRNPEAGGVWYRQAGAKRDHILHFCQ